MADRAECTLVTESGHARISTWRTGFTVSDEVTLPYAAHLAVIRRAVADLAGQPVSKDIVMMVTTAPR